MSEAQFGGFGGDLAHLDDPHLDGQVAQAPVVVDPFGVKLGLGGAQASLDGLALDLGGPLLVRGPKAEAEQIKAQLAVFLKDTLKLQRARFLGYDISTRHQNTWHRNGRRTLNSTGRSPYMGNIWVTRNADNSTPREIFE